MASVNADIRANEVATPPSRSKVNRQMGRVRIFEATVTPTAAVAIGEKITWGSLPKGARVLGNMSKLYFSAGTAASTLNLGDAASAARHLAATAINAAGSAVPEAANASGAQFETSDDSSAATNDCTLISTVAGAAIPIGQVHAAHGLRAGLTPGRRDAADR
jgi:hypothetical protein